MRTILALVFAPLAGILIGALYFNLSHPEGFGWQDGVSLDRLGITVVYLVLAAKVTYPATIALGWPMSVVLERRGIRSLLIYLLLGPIIGLLAYATWLSIGSSDFHCAVLWWRVVGCIRSGWAEGGNSHPLLIGVVTSGVFWMFKVPKKPGNQMKFIILTSISWVVGIGAYLLSFAVFYHQMVSAFTLSEVVFWSLAATSVAVPVCYLPSMYLLRRLGVTRTPSIVLASCCLSVIPTLLLLRWLRWNVRDFLSLDASPFHCMFIAFGIVFGIGIARIYGTTRNVDPMPPGSHLPPAEITRPSSTA